MTPKQKEQFNNMRRALIQIRRGFETPSQLRKNCGNCYGLDYEETIEMAYENMQCVAGLAVKGVKELK